MDTQKRRKAKINYKPAPTDEQVIIEPYQGSLTNTPQIGSLDAHPTQIVDEKMVESPPRPAVPTQPPNRRLQPWEARAVTLGFICGISGFFVLRTQYALAGTLVFFLGVVMAFISIIARTRPRGSYVWLILIASLGFAFGLAAAALITSIILFTQILFFG